MNADTMQGTGDPGEAHPDAQAAEAVTPIESAVSAPEPDLHQTLLEGVSAEALAAGEGSSVEPGAQDAPPAEDLTVVPEEAAAPVPAATETVEATQAVAETVETAEAAVETVAQAVPETIAAVPDAVAASVPAAVPGLPDLRALMDFSKAPRIAAVMGEFGEVNATVLSYLRGEGAAALAHWQALSGARTPADALRLQVDEMQRAADASLNCFSAIAQRASRLTGTIGRP
ncbi:phasin family protein [Methylobacterium sp.]|uniref:phasin family protein n=1 Tax=Methylobacterium sp. TaxID=409 RepID=UPI0025CE85E9|nr:phasin family protein [Methylobacterium sp.]MBY0257080.1 Phasin [Methylobacterium sp.]